MNNPYPPLLPFYAPTMKTFYITALFLLSLAGIGYSQPSHLVDQAEHYSITTVARQAGAKNLNELAGLDSLTGLDITHIYYDGLGRVVQTVNRAAGPGGHDVVQPLVYPANGSPQRAYLPYTDLGTGHQPGSYRSGALSSQQSFYQNGQADVAQDTHPYAELLTDDTPLHRPQEQGHYGAAWQPLAGHAVTFGRALNQAQQVHYWQGTNGSAYYPAGQLRVTEVVNEDGARQRRYTDKQGRLVLEQREVADTLADAQGNLAVQQFLSTYYVYNRVGRLQYLVPPKAVQHMEQSGTFSLSAELLQKYVHQYTYSPEGLLLQKTIPNQGTTHFVYDPFDRLVLVQTAGLQAGGQWLYIKYDSQNRPVMRGLYQAPAGSNAASLAQQVSSFYGGGGARYEQPAPQAATHYYTNQSYPSQGLTPQMVLYYDGYDISQSGQPDFSYQPRNLGAGEPQASSYTRGLLTVQKQLTDRSGVWLHQAYFYDRQERPVQKQSENLLLLPGQLDTETLVYNFDGSLHRRLQYQAKADLSVQQRYVYDHAGRLTELYQTLGQEPERPVARYRYNALGQLSEKDLLDAGGNALQSTDYRYTIRGWLAGINDPLAGPGQTETVADYFSLSLDYEQQATGLNNQPRYGGAISAVRWSNATTAESHSYVNEYDAAGQLRQARYQAGAGQQGSSWNQQTDFYSVKHLNYDANGNLASLQRWGKNQQNQAEQIDRLQMTLSGNQLLSVADLSQNPAGFAAHAQSPQYGYDGAGNQTHDPYKELETLFTPGNQPKEITKAGQAEPLRTYDYGADGQLLATRETDGPAPRSVHQVGEFVYHNGELAYVLGPEGRVRPLEDESGTPAGWAYDFFMQDHLGNVRAVYTDSPELSTYRATMESEYQSYQDSLFIDEYLPGANPPDHLGYRQPGRGRPAKRPPGRVPGAAAQYARVPRR